jgi:hypothetical protein
VGAVAVSAATAVVGGFLYGGFFWWALRRARRTYSRAIVHQLKTTGRPVVIGVSDRRGAWNPARKEAAGRLFANGTAEYTLDYAGTVHLRFSPAGGTDQHYEGPIPAWHDSPQGRQRQRLIRRVWVAYVAWLLVGFGVGLALAAGSTARRIGFGVGGLFLAMLLVSLATTALRVTLAVRTAFRERSKS